MSPIKSPLASALSTSSSPTTLLSRQQYVPIAKKNISIKDAPAVSYSDDDQEEDDDDDAEEEDVSYEPSDEAIAAAAVEDDEAGKEIVEGQDDVDSEELLLQKSFPLTNRWDYVIPQTRSVHLALQSKSKRELAYSVFKKKCSDLSAAETNFIKSIHYHIPRRDSVFPIKLKDFSIIAADRSYYFGDQASFIETILNRARKDWSNECLTFVIPSLEGIAKRNPHLKSLIFNGSAETVEDDYLYSFETHTKDYAINMAALQMSFPKCKESGVTSISIQDIVVYVQESVQSSLSHVPNLRFYQSDNYNASYLALCSMQSEEFAKCTNSITDLTVFTYNFKEIDSYFHPMLESFFIHIMMSHKRSKTCDLLFGEWVLILREYWRLCTNDLKDYDENVPRPEEKKTTLHTAQAN